MKRKSKKTLKNPALDLFGEVIITKNDVLMWVSVVTRGRYTLRSKRFDWYVQEWDVVGKVRRFKLAGLFADIEQQYLMTYAANDSQY